MFSFLAMPFRWIVQNMILMAIYLFEGIVKSSINYHFKINAFKESER